jgi:hypothetical protein
MAQRPLYRRVGFCLTNNDRRNRVFRRLGERYSQCAIHQIDNFGGGSVMVWGGINWTCRTEVVVVADRPEIYKPFTIISNSDCL